MKVSMMTALRLLPVVGLCYWLLYYLLVIDSCAESDHLPVVLTFVRKASTAKTLQKSNAKHCKGHSEPGHVRYTEKITWNCEKQQENSDNKRSNELQNRLKKKEALENIENDIEDALCSFVDCLTSASNCMVKNCYTSRKFK